ncbi:MAG: AMP-binding protein [Gemmobacter sp.]|nr:AMP-binding protein [Gemmobacter sp.]
MTQSGTVEPDKGVSAMTAALEDNLVDRIAIADVLRRRARDSGDALALVDYSVEPSVRLTFSDLNCQANRFGRVLQGQGATKGDRVVVLSSNCTDIAATMYACFKTGMVYVPLNFMMSDNDLVYVVDHCEPASAIVHPSLARRWKEIEGQLAIKPKVVVMGDVAVEGFTPLGTLAASVSDADHLDVILGDRDPVQILYTSGTTSRPKGVVNTNQNVFISSLNMALLFTLSRGDSYASPLPLFHITAQGHMLMTHQVGGMFVVSSFEAEKFARIMEDERINGVFLLPMMWKAMLELPDIATRNFSSLKRALYAMAPMAPSVMDRLHAVFGCAFNQTSGQTETNVVTKFYDGSAVEFPGANYWGVPAPIADQAVLDDDGNELMPGQVGEICWRSPSTMLTYFRNDEALREARRFGWHHSGDLGMIDSQGQLRFVDRKKDMVKSGGENVSSMRVEQVILGLPGVVAAAVVGLPHPKWEEAVTAFVRLGPGATLTAAQIMATCRTELSRFEVPKHIEIVDFMPATPTGKIKKHELRQAYADIYQDGGA